jgi:hypothetical protein
MARVLNGRIEISWLTSSNSGVLWVTIRKFQATIRLRPIMSDFDISTKQYEDQVEITDLDAQVDGFKDSVSILLLRFVRSLPFGNQPRGRFILLIYFMCIVVLLFMIQPGLPAMPEHFTGTSAHELQYPLAVYPFTMKDTSSAQSVTWIRISDGRVITVQAAPGKIVWHHCKLQRLLVPPKYAHPTVVICR